MGGHDLFYITTEVHNNQIIIEFYEMDGSFASPLVMRLKLSYMPMSTDWSNNRHTHGTKKNVP